MPTTRSSTAAGRSPQNDPLAGFIALDDDVAVARRIIANHSLNATSALNATAPSDRSVSTLSERSASLTPSTTPSVYQVAPTPPTTSRSEAKSTTIGTDHQQSLVNEDTLSKLVSSLGKIAVNDSAFNPRPFSGIGRDADLALRWLDQYEKYTAFRSISGAERLQLFKLLMTDQASDWLRALPSTTTDDYDTLIKEFRKRHQLSQVDIWQRTIAIWSAQQASTESADDFINTMQSRARAIKLPDNQLCSAILQGLRPATQLYVLQSKANTLDGIREAARVTEAAEAAQRRRPTTDQSVIPVNIWDNEAISALHNPPSQDAERRRVQFAPPGSTTNVRPVPRGNQHPSELNRGPPPACAWEERQGPPTLSDRWAAQENRQRTEHADPRPRPPINNYNNNNILGTCRNCGRAREDSRHNCPAARMACFRCGREGHISRMCRSQPQNSRFNNGGRYSRP